MDGSKFGGGFERMIEDAAKSTTSTVKNTITSTATQASGSITGFSKSETAGEPSAIEKNTGNASQAAQLLQNTATDQTKEAAEKAKIERLRQELHTKTYFNPTFHEKPAQIKQQREKKWFERQQEEQQKKQEKQMEAIQEEKKKEEFMPIALDLKAKGEIGKVGSG